MRSRRAVILALSSVAVLLLASCGGDDGEPAAGGGDETQEPAAAVTGTLQASDQETDGTTITVDSTTIDGAVGWIAVHTDLDGAPGPVIGVAAVDEGDNSNVEITLDEPLTKTAKLWPMLHVDDHELGTYEFAKVEGADAPVLDGDKPVMMQITVKVGDGVGAPKGDLNITISGFAFGTDLTVEPGGKVVVSNTDPESHTVTADDGAFDTDVIAPSEFAIFKAPMKPGTYAFHCSIHTQMHGSLEVK